MVRAAAVILLLGGCSQAQPPVERDGKNPYAEIAAEIAAEQERKAARASPKPRLSPALSPFGPTADDLRRRAEQSALRAQQSQEFYEQQKIERLERRVRQLEDAQINGAH